MKTSADSDLLARARCFDLQALAEIYDRFSPGLFAYSYRLLGNSAEAEEAVSETFTRLLGTLKKGVGPEDHLQAYLYRIAHNWIMDQFRRKPPPMIPLEDDLAGEEKQSFDQAISHNLWNEQVRAALQYLTPDQRQVILLKYVEGWENEKISAAVGKPVGSVKSLQHRGLAALRRLLVEEGEVDDEN